MYDVDLHGPTALLLGGRATGLVAEVLRAADSAHHDSDAAPVESLNVAVAAAVLVYEARRQRI